MLRVSGKVGDSDKDFELIIPDARLRAAMLVYSRNIALLSLLISLITATLVFLAINAIMIRPIRDMTRSMLTFSRAPDDPGKVIRPENRDDEIGVAERELAEMQLRLQRMLSEQKHLADLGLAVSKINHDMRNILASAQLMSDRLRRSRIRPCSHSRRSWCARSTGPLPIPKGVLAYGRTQEAAPARRRLRLRTLVEEVHGLLGMDPEGGIEFENAVDPDFEVDADSEQLFRVLTNLCRNAVAGDGRRPRARFGAAAHRLRRTTRQRLPHIGHRHRTGPASQGTQNLFAAFRGSARSGGTGLGLAIAHELVRAHGGTLGAGGERQRPDGVRDHHPRPPVRLDEARSVLRRPA